MTAAGRLILLIGMRGTGKTTIGERLAERLAIPFFDLDREARNRLGGRSVTDIWQTDGEAAWREAEAASFDHLFTSRDANAPCLIALGGGTPLIPAVHDRLSQLRDEARIIWLQAPPDTIRARLRAKTDRPSLTGSTVLDEIGDVLQQREPVYRALATFAVDTDDRSIDEVVDVIVRELESTDHAAR